MVVDFSKLDLREQPVLVLKNAAGDIICALGYALNVHADIMYNETSTLEFDLPAEVDGIPTPYYDSVIGLRIIELQDVGQFVLVNPGETNEGVRKMKSCKAYSLEYEFTFKNISLEKGTYNFWDKALYGNTVLGIIQSLMPSWSVGTVSDSLIGRYRTFDVSGENVYNFIKGTLQQTYGCIFDFDTFNRRINVIDAASSVRTEPIYISNLNLAEEIKVEENTEDIVTRLQVEGADGVTIRDANPSGTNYLINLDYFMTTDNFPQTLINKYYAWKKTYESYQKPYYNASIEYSLQVSRKVSESAALVELQGELTSLENQQAVIIQGIAKGLQTQAALDSINAKIRAKENEISAKEQEIKDIQAEADGIYRRLEDMNKATDFESYFTRDEYLVLNRYIKDGSVSDSTFVAEETKSYADDDIGSPLSGSSFAIKDAKVTWVSNSAGRDIYEVKGGSIECEALSSLVIKAAFQKSQDGGFVMTAYLGDGHTSDNIFRSACLSLSGKVSTMSTDVKADPSTPDIKEGTSLSFTAASGYLYFTLDTSEYEKRAVAWDLYEYGEEVLAKSSQPSYTFNLTTANFLCLDDFIMFKDRLRNGEKVYIGISEDKTLSPICIGVKFRYDDITSLELVFGNTYTATDSTFRLADLLEQSVSMGKDMDLGRFDYSAFVDSGANTFVHDFMTRALDVAKNAILSTKDQAITWGDSGIRLRKWADGVHTRYEPQEVWMNNNSILMTNDNWNTAEIAIGQFKDTNLGDCWGIVAPTIVGTLLAGNNLVIESAKKDGSTSVFRVDGNGCVLYNSTLSVVNRAKNTHILLDPDHGFMIGKYPLVSSDGKINEANRLFYADTNGNLTLKGTIYASAGEFTGKITAQSGYIGDPVNGWTITSTSIYNKKPGFNNTTQGVYIGTDGISLGSGAKYVKMSKDGLLSAVGADISGRIKASSGYIGDSSSGWVIGNTSIYNSKSSYSSSTQGVYIGTDGISLGNSTNYVKMSKGGVLTAVGANITGTIHATTGIIGGFLIQDNGTTSGGRDSHSLVGQGGLYTSISADRIDALSTMTCSGYNVITTYELNSVKSRLSSAETSIDNLRNRVRALESSSGEK